MEVVTYELSGKNSSRMLKGKLFTKDGATYKIETELDTLSKPSSFITSFFDTFTPVNLKEGIDVRQKKAAFFFIQFFSNDSVQHKRAVANINSVVVDSTDFINLKSGIESLSWKEKKYIDVKKDFIRKLSSMETAASAYYLSTLYYAAADTVALQYTILETLLQQKTAYAYTVFSKILQNDPPVLNVDKPAPAYSTRSYRSCEDYDYTDASNFSDGSFLDNLTDTLQLTAGIYKALLTLINSNDYEQPIMNLTAKLIDSNLIAPKDYEAYLPKFILEARQALKKQLIKEKSKSIEKKAEGDEEKKSYNYYGRNNQDNGNNGLNLFATLLLPFWNYNPQVPQIFNQLLQSSDKRLKYNTALLLLRNKRSLPDTLLQYLASLDDYRYELYTDLKRVGQLNRFPGAYKNQMAIARSQLLSIQSYTRPDTIAFMQKVLFQHKNRSGYIYVFKYKEKSEDNSWKLATVGILPKDESLYEFEEKGNPAYNEFDFTDVNGAKLTSDTSETEQLEKLLKRLKYSKRKSAAQFYNDGGRYKDIDFSRIRQ